jgi:hypothetical protein
MNAYRVTEASINVHAGTLGLSPSQADARLHRLTKLGGNRYEVRDPPVVFKRGEVFEYEGELPKTLVAGVEKAELLAALHPMGSEGPKRKSKP